MAYHCSHHLVKATRTLSWLTTKASHSINSRSRYSRLWAWSQAGEWAWLTRSSQTAITLRFQLLGRNPVSGCSGLVMVAAFHLSSRRITKRHQMVNLSRPITHSRTIRALLSCHSRQAAPEASNSLALPRGTDLAVVALVVPSNSKPFIISKQTSSSNSNFTPLIPP